MFKFAVIIGRSNTGYSAHVPDLPGCVAADDTLEATDKLIREAIEFHIEGMRREGLSIPKPITVAEMIDVA